MWIAPVLTATHMCCKINSASTVKSTHNQNQNSHTQKYIYIYLDTIISKGRKNNNKKCQPASTRKPFFFFRQNETQKVKRKTGKERKQNRRITCHSY